MSIVDALRDKQLENNRSCTGNYINVFVNTNPYHLVTQGPFLQYFVERIENICCYCELLDIELSLIFALFLCENICCYYEPSDIVLSSAKQLSGVPHHPDAQCMHKHINFSFRFFFTFLISLLCIRFYICYISYIGYKLYCSINETII